MTYVKGTCSGAFVATKSPSEIWCW